MKTIPLLISLCLAITGCTLGAPKQLAPSKALQAQFAALYAQRTPALTSIRRWRATGRLAVSSPQQGGSAAFDWTQSPQQREVRLSAPLGQGGAVLIETPTRASLVTTDRQSFNGSSAQDLLAQAFGWDVPVQDLSHWMLGLPGSSQDYELDAFGRLAQLRDGEWKVEFRSYQRQSDGVELPERVFLTRGEYSVRLVVTNWRRNVA